MHREWLIRGLKLPSKSGVGLAKAMGVDPSIVSKMVSGKRRIQAEEITQIARYLGVPEPRSADNGSGVDSLRTLPQPHSSAEVVSTLGARMRKARERVGLSQSKVGEAIAAALIRPAGSFTASAVGQWEADKTEPTPSALAAFATLTQADWNWLLTELSTHETSPAPDRESVPRGNCASAASSVASWECHRCHRVYPTPSGPASARSQSRTQRSMQGGWAERTSAGP